MIYFSRFFYTQLQITEERCIFRYADRDCRSKYKSRSVVSNLLDIIFFGRSQTNIQVEVLLKEVSEHSHAPDPDRLHVIRLKNEIKHRGASSDEGASTILFDVLRTTPLTATPGLPTNDALLQIIRRERSPMKFDHHGC
ncbi:unnamed protein product [Rotaria sordida]|uniref:Uncharacterized protein n=1 Tax=Rotaria sordida TaxID=392033 RepID=A0A819ZIR2_9BILA|nr:unnamed protein product [Rotaria sordida]CAF4175020.1 unnamed protein product [Rotaria sordida]